MGLIFKKSTAQPAFTVAAAITGTVQVGQTLTCTYTVTKARANNVTVRWYSYFDAFGTDQVLIGTGTTYVLTGNELGRYIRTIVTASNPAGTVQSTSSYTAAVTTEVPPDPPTIESAAAITGTLEVGQTLTVFVTFSGADSVAYQWYSYTSAGGSGASALGTSTTQALTAAEDGKYIGCQATGTNTTDSTVSAATIVGPVASNASEAPVVVSAAAVTLDEGADGYNEGEYIICDAEFSGHTSTPTFTWYKCDNLAKDNAEVITLLDGEGVPYNAGETPIRPLFVSEPNHWRGALFLDQSLGLNIGGKYVYCVASATNGAGTTPSESAAVGPIGAIQGAPITQAMVGDGPYYLPLKDTTYYLAENIRTTGTGIISNKANQTLNLNGKTLTFDDAEPTGLVNGGFETGDFTGWDRTNAPDTAIYTVSDAEDDFNNRRHHRGSYSCVFSSAIHAEPVTEQYLEQANIALTQWKWYSLSAIFSMNGYSRLSVTVLHQGEVVATNSYGYTGNRFYGHRPVEVVFQAYHDDPTYTIRVGITGEAGGTYGVYLDDVKLTRTRCAGVMNASSNANSAKFVDAVSIESGGSGYSDGAYVNLQSVWYSGGTLSSSAFYPRFDVTVSGGVVTEIAINYPGVYVFPDEMQVTIPNTLLGGAGSGLVINIDGCAVRTSLSFWYGGAMPPLDHTTRFNTGGLSTVVKNGVITQGADAGSICYGIWHEGVNGQTVPTINIHRLTIDAPGDGSYCIRRAGSRNGNAVIADCYLSALHGVNYDRHNPGSAAVCDMTGVFARNTLLHSGGTGYEHNGVVQVYGNTFRNRAYYTNRSSLPLGGVGSKAYDNLFDNTGEFFGRCMHASLASDVEVYNNVMKMQASRLCPEYGGQWYEGEHAIQLETSEPGGRCDVHDNVIEAYASGGVLTNGYVLMSNCLRWTKAGTDALLTVRNNTLRAYATGDGYATIYKIGRLNKDGSVDVRDNVIETDSGYLDAKLGEIWARSVRDNVTILPLVANNRHVFSLGNDNASTTPNDQEYIDWDIVDPILSAESLAILVASPTYVWPHQGDGVHTTLGGYRIKWTITIATGSAGSTVVIKDSGNATVASGTSEADGTFVAELQQYYISGNAPAADTSSYTVTVNANTPVAFVADSVKTINAPA